MNREMRRHPVAAKPSSGGKAPNVRPTLMGGASTGVSRGRGTRGATPRFMWARDVVSELRKVQWPTWTESWHLTLVVLLVSVVVGVALGGLDSGFGWFMQHTILR